MSNVTKIKLNNGRILNINFKGLPDDFDVDRIIRVDYNNIEAEIITTPLVMNSIGFVLAETANEVRLAELDLKKQKAIMAESARDEIREEKNGKPATNDEVLEYIRRQPKYDIMNRKVSSAMKKHDLINSIYWSIKAKQEILQNISKSMNFGDFQDALVHTAIKEINYCKLNVVKPLID